MSLDGVLDLICATFMSKKVLGKLSINNKWVHVCDGTFCLLRSSHSIDRKSTNSYRLKFISKYLFMLILFMRISRGIVLQNTRKSLLPKPRRQTVFEPFRRFSSNKQLITCASLINNKALMTILRKVQKKKRCTSAKLIHCFWVASCDEEKACEKLGGPEFF